MALIVRTQLIPPKVKKNLLRRDRLLKILNDNLDKKLIIVIGGAGYGKTTLLAQFVEELKAKSRDLAYPGSLVFYTLSEVDSNLNSFISSLITGIRSIYPHFGNRTYNLLSQDRVELQMVMGTFVNELLETIDNELIIVLDDYHLVGEVKIINRAVDYLLTHMPSNIHLIISSRSEPQLSIANFRAKGNLLELLTSDLRFNIDEIQILLKEIYKLPLDERIIKEIAHYSEGWITALQLLSYAIERDPKQQGRLKDVLQHIRGGANFEYFQSEVFERQPEEVRSFLLGSCILEQMNPDACNIILRRSDSRQILELLIKKNLFISCLDEQSELFRYHPLFREFLLNRLSKEMGNRYICSLHLRAANYFKKTNDYSNSIRHYFSANDMQSALKLVEKEGKNLIEQREFEVLERWLNTLPENMVHKSITLLWYQGEILRSQGKWDEAMKAYKEANALAIKQGDKAKSAKVIWGMAAISFYRGDYAKAVRLGKSALKLIGKQNLLRARVLNTIGGSYIGLGNIRKAILFLSEGIRICKKLKHSVEEKVLLHNLLVCYAEFGEHDKLIEISERIIKKEGGTKYPIGWTYTNLGYAYALKGEYERAENALQNSLQLHKSFNDIRGTTNAVMILGYLNLMKGSYEASRSYYEEALKLNIEMGERKVNEHSLYGISMSYLLEGKLLQAEEYINKIFTGQGETEVRGKGIFLITKGEIQLESGALEEAEEVLNLAFSHLQKSQSKYELTLAYAAMSKLYYMKKEEELVAKFLKKLLWLSKKYGYGVALIRLGRLNSSLLQFAIKHGIEPRYATFLLEELYKQYDLIISFFGGLEIKSQGKKIEKKWETQKAKSLFCYLLVNRNKSFTPDQLMELLWPGKSFSKAQSSLHHALFCVRDIVSSFIEKESPFIEYKDGCYRVSSDYKIWLDSEEFEKLISEARQEEAKGNELSSISKYESAINFYQGDFLPELYELWSEEKRMFYKEQYLRALDKASNFYMKKERFEKVIEYSKKIIAIDEFCEQAYLLAMRSYIALGNRKVAVDLYKQLEKTLKDELNIEPSPEIKQLFYKLTE